MAAPEEEDLCFIASKKDAKALESFAVFAKVSMKDTTSSYMMIPKPSTITALTSTTPTSSKLEIGLK